MSAVADRPVAIALAAPLERHRNLDPTTDCAGMVRFTDVRSRMLETECELCGDTIGVRRDVAASLIDSAPEGGERWWDR